MSFGKWFLEIHNSVGAKRVQHFFWCNDSKVNPCSQEYQSFMTQIFPFRDNPEGLEVQYLVLEKSMLSTQLCSKPAHFPGSLALPLSHCEKDEASV